MANIWKENQDVNEHPNRNNFDLSFQNHLTMKMGTLYPVFCKEVVPGDSFKIDTAIGLKFMPLVFPVQSKMRAHMSYFYVRNKNLWNRWENWLSNLKEEVHPYISQPAGFFKTGSIADYLDIPTTIVSQTSDWQSIKWRINDNYDGSSKVDSSIGRSRFDFSEKDSASGYTGTTSSSQKTIANRVGAKYDQVIGSSESLRVGAIYSHNVYLDVVTPIVDDAVCTLSVLYEQPIINPPIDVQPSQEHTNINVIRLQWPDSLPNDNDSGVYYTLYIYECSENSDYLDSVCIARYTQNIDTFVTDGVADFYYDSGVFDSSLFNSSGKKYYVALQAHVMDWPYYFFVSSVRELSNVPSGSVVCMFPRNLSFYMNADGVIDSPQSTPFDSTIDRIRLSALPFRAYESIYNAYYRNTQNQPFVVDGEERFNEYNTTLESGADTTDYHLYRRNYEMDFLTSALPSPQQGIAPLVGISALGDVTIEDENGITTARAEIDDDGTITKISLTSPAASIDHARTAMNIAQAGMSINDFRNVNALQRWLETNIRKGYKYIDFVEGHFGTKPEYRELDMPEFIGGFSENVTVGTVTSMSDTSGISDNSAGKVLGEFGGTAACFAQSGHSVTHYCDDYGFIVGILCVVPSPAYSQLLPKQYLKSQPLDYYFPEFAQLGLQPITYREVAPVQMYQQEVQTQGEVRLEDTFGYQRPNYDLVAYTDQVHGQFRTSLRNFLINRVFADVPQLGTEFLEINPNEINDIFAYTAPAEDNIIGQIVFDVKAKRPVPRVTIPSLGK